MLSTFINTEINNNVLLPKYETNLLSDSALVNVYYQENNYQALLEQLQNDENEGWILFLAPPGKPNTTFFEEAGIDKSRVLMIDANKVKDNVSMLSTLLQSNNYNTIVTWVNELSKDIRLALEVDAKSTDTKCFIYCKH